MPWGFFTELAGGQFGNSGKAFWTRPTLTFPIPATAFIEMALPSSVAALAQRVSWAKYQGRDYGVGGWTDNILWTEHMEIVRMGMEAPNVIPTVSLVAGPGITADVVCYLSYYDAKTNERSPLSAASETLAAANQQVQWDDFPTPLDSRPTHIELWRSVDGSLPRLVQRRQLGVVSVTEAVALGDLGEAFTETFGRFPRCRYNAIYHERQVMAGDDEHPDTLYLSLLNEAERYSFLTLRTRNGERIIGLTVVRDRLVVICPFSRYTVQGFTEDDLNMQISEPQIGGLNHWAVVMVHGNAWLWTHLGLYLTDGSTSFYVGEDVQAKWATQFRKYQDNYEDAWAIHDPIRHVVKLWVSTHDDLPANGYWVADYEEVVAQVGGQLGQPRWSYDVRARNDHSAGFLSLPGSKRGDIYTGSCDGYVRQENFDNYPNTSATDDDGDDLGKRLLLRHGANFMLDVGGTLAQGKHFNPLDVFVESEANDWDLSIFTGDEYAHPGGQLPPNASYQPSYGPKTVLASAILPGGFGAVMQPKGSHPFPLSRCVGRAYVFELMAESPQRMRYRGHQMYWKEGPAPRLPSYVTQDPG